MYAKRSTAKHVMTSVCMDTLPVDGSGTAPLSPMVRLGTGLISDKLVMICGNKRRFALRQW